MADIVLGVIADDLTGATDVALALSRAGMHTVVVVGVPDDTLTTDVDAAVIALKSRTIPAEDAVALSVKACRWLTARAVRQIYFKICSTFDSTIHGNIGPVIEALMDELNCKFSVVVPGFPDNARTVFMGHLFVNDALLSESGMQCHPLTPMTDPNLVRFLQLQLNRGSSRRTGLIDYRIVETSAVAIANRIQSMRMAGISIAVADTISNQDVAHLAAALADAPFVTASSALGSALPAQWGFTPKRHFALPRAQGRRAIIAGSCSPMTNRQVAHYTKQGGAAQSIDPLLLAADYDDQIRTVKLWVRSCWAADPTQPLLIYSTVDAVTLKHAHVEMGASRSGGIIEKAFSEIAVDLVESGAGQLLVAGGETSGACILGLSIRMLEIGPEIDPGVAWCYATSRGKSLHLGLKSGNFGSFDFFTKAFAILE